MIGMPLVSHRCITKPIRRRSFLLLLVHMNSLWPAFAYKRGLTFPQCVYGAVFLVLCKLQYSTGDFAVGVA